MIPLIILSIAATSLAQIVFAAVIVGRRWYSTLLRGAVVSLLGASSAGGLWLAGGALTGAGELLGAFVLYTLPQAVALWAIVLYRVYEMVVVR